MVQRNLTQEIDGLTVWCDIAFFMFTMIHESAKFSISGVKFSYATMCSVLKYWDQDAVSVKPVILVLEGEQMTCSHATCRSLRLTLAWDITYDHFRKNSCIQESIPIFGVLSLGRVNHRDQQVPWHQVAYSRCNTNITGFTATADSDSDKPTAEFIEQLPVEVMC